MKESCPFSAILTFHFPISAHPHETPNQDLHHTCGAVRHGWLHLANNAGRTT